MKLSLKKALTLSVSAGISVFALLGVQPPAQAGFGNIIDSVTDTLGDLDPTNPNNTSSPLMNFEICNHTGHTMYYSLNTSSKSLRDGYCAQYTRYPVGTDISFDWSYSGGYQGEWYDLRHGREYTFRKLNNNAGVDLYSG